MRECNEKSRENGWNECNDFLKFNGIPGRMQKGSRS